MSLDFKLIVEQSNDFIQPTGGLVFPAKFSTSETKLLAIPLQLKIFSIGNDPSCHLKWDFSIPNFDSKILDVETELEEKFIKIHKKSDEIQLYDCETGKEMEEDAFKLEKQFIDLKLVHSLSKNELLLTIFYGNSEKKTEVEGNPDIILMGSLIQISPNAPNQEIEENDQEQTQENQADPMQAVSTEERTSKEAVKNSKVAVEEEEADDDDLEIPECNFGNEESVSIWLQASAAFAEQRKKSKKNSISQVHVGKLSYNLSNKKKTSMVDIVVEKPVFTVGGVMSKKMKMKNFVSPDLEINGFAKYAVGIFCEPLLSKKIVKNTEDFNFSTYYLQILSPGLTTVEISDKGFFEFKSEFDKIPLSDGCNFSVVSKSTSDPTQLGIRKYFTFHHIPCQNPQKELQKPKEIQIQKEKFNKHEPGISETSKKDKKTIEKKKEHVNLYEEETSNKKKKVIEIDADSEDTEQEDKKMTNDSNELEDACIDDWKPIISNSFTHSSGSNTKIDDRKQILRIDPIASVVFLPDKLSKTLYSASEQPEPDNFVHSDINKLIFKFGSDAQCDQKKGGWDFVALEIISLRNQIRQRKRSFSRKNEAISDKIEYQYSLIFNKVGPTTKILIDGTEIDKSQFTIHKNVEFEIVSGVNQKRKKYRIEFLKQSLENEVEEKKEDEEKNIPADYKPNQSFGFSRKESFQNKRFFNLLPKHISQDQKPKDEIHEEEEERENKRRKIETIPSRNEKREKSKEDDDEDVDEDEMVIVDD